VVVAACATGGCKKQEAIRPSARSAKAQVDELARKWQTGGKSLRYDLLNDSLKWTPCTDDDFFGHCCGRGDEFERNDCLASVRGFRTAMARVLDTNSYEVRLPVEATYDFKAHSFRVRLLPPVQMHNRPAMRGLAEVEVPMDENAARVHPMRTRPQDVTATARIKFVAAVSSSPSGLIEQHELDPVEVLGVRIVAPDGTVLHESGSFGQSEQEPGPAAGR
jgi:hypothetical protein